MATERRVILRGYYPGSNVTMTGAISNQTLLNEGVYKRPVKITANTVSGTYIAHLPSGRKLTIRQKDIDQNPNEVHWMDTDEALRYHFDNAEISKTTERVGSGYECTIHLPTGIKVHSGPYYRYSNKESAEYDAAHNALKLLNLIEK